MNNSQKQSISGNVAAPPITTWIGLDWADRKHDLVVQAMEGQHHRQTLQVDHKPQALEEALLGLRRQYPRGRIGVCVEQSRGPLIYALMKYDFVVIYPINPRALADFRRAFSGSGAKSDERDADLLCEIGCKHHPRLRPLQIEDESTRKLRLLVEARRGFVDQNTACLNQLRAVLKGYYPLVVEMFGEQLDSSMAREFLRRWPNLGQLQAARPATLRAFFYALNSRSEKRIAQRLEAIKEARALTEDGAIVSALQLEALGLVQQIGTLQKVLRQYDEHIRRVFESHSEAWLFRELPGAGPALAPRLAAAFGTQRANWAQALDLLTLSGVAPVRKQSGHQQVVHFRYARPKFLHQSFVEFAKCSIPQCGWARLLYEHQLQRGKSKFSAIRVVAFKWLRILWRCWMDRKPYDENQYLRRLQTRGIQLYAPLFGVLSTQPVTVNKN
jgi:transposase